MPAATSIACENSTHERCPMPADCLCECHDQDDPRPYIGDAQDIAEAKADEKLQALKEDGPRHDLDEYDAELEDADRRANEQAIKRGW